MGEDTDTRKINHGFLRDHNYVTEGNVKVLAWSPLLRLIAGAFEANDKLFTFPALFKCHDNPCVAGYLGPG